MKTPRVTNTLQELVSDYENAKKRPDTFYAQELLNRNGCVYNNENEKITISDLIVEWMLRDKPFQGVERIIMPDNMTYLIDGHTGHPTTKTENSNRQEELVAMALFMKKDYPDSDIDCFVDYQVPVYRGHDYEEAHLGKIDLVAVSHSSKKVLLMELKKYSSHETLLRCAAECYTYYKQIDTKRLAEEVAVRTGNPLVREYDVCPAVLVFNNQRQHMQYNSELYGKVRELMTTLGIRMYVIKSTLQYSYEEYEKYIQQSNITDITEVN